MGTQLKFLTMKFTSLFCNPLNLCAWMSVTFRVHGIFYNYIRGGRTSDSHGWLHTVWNKLNLHTQKITLFFIFEYQYSILSHDCSWDMGLLWREMSVSSPMTGAWVLIDQNAKCYIFSWMSFMSQYNTAFNNINFLKILNATASQKHCTEKVGIFILWTEDISHRKRKGGRSWRPGHYWGNGVPDHAECFVKSSLCLQSWISDTWCR